jgi:hypothetical protein
MGDRHLARFTSRSTLSSASSLADHLPEMTAGQPFSFTPLARGQHPKGRVFGQPPGVVDVLLVARRLSMDWRKRFGV